MRTSLLATILISMSLSHEFMNILQTLGITIGIIASVYSIFTNYNNNKKQKNE
jgi:uncharacterized membrane protein YebE (DUF533 family)